MKFLVIVCACFLTLVSASPHGSYSFPPTVPGIKSEGAAAESPVAKVAEIVKDERVNNGDGSYSFNVETSDGVVSSQSGSPGKNSGYNQQGNVSFTHPGGEKFSLKYVADENGFQPESANLPVAPEAPQFVLDQIAAAKEEDKAAIKSEKPSPSYGSHPVSPPQPPVEPPPPPASYGAPPVIPPQPTVAPPPPPPASYGAPPVSPPLPTPDSPPPPPPATNGALTVNPPQPPVAPPLPPPPSSPPMPVVLPPQPSDVVLQAGPPESPVATQPLQAPVAPSFISSELLPMPPQLLPIQPQSADDAPEEAVILPPGFNRG